MYKGYSLDGKSIHCRVGVGGKSVANRISNKIFIQLTTKLITPNQVTINEGEETAIKIRVNHHFNLWCAGGNAKNFDDCKMVVHHEQVYKHMY